MPLRARVADREVIAPLLEDADYARLRDELRRRHQVAQLPCCDGEAFLRTSKLGTRHFVHRADRDCSGTGETLAHLWLKAEIVSGCESVGWSAQTEASGDGWRADVLASRGDARVAFEVQWSAQDEATTRERQRRYAADGVRGCWLYRGEVAAPSRELPLFALKPNAGRATVVHAGHELEVREFVARLLTRRVRFVESGRVKRRVNFITMDCWRCDKAAHIFFAEQRSVCGHRVFDDVDAFDRDVLARVDSWLNSAGRGAVEIGAIKRRYSKTVGRSYLSFGCPRCDALFGDFFIGDAVLEARIYPEQVVASFEYDGVASGAFAEHWCLGADDFCG